MAKGMEITEVYVKLVSGEGEKLRAFATVILNGCFVVRDIKVINGPGGLFVSMPSRKLTIRCPNCRAKIELTSFYCSQCGCKLPAQVLPRRPNSDRPKLHADIAHPITPDCRKRLEQAVLAEFQLELTRARRRQPEYRPQPAEEIEDAGPEADLEEELLAPQNPPDPASRPAPETDAP